MNIKGLLKQAWDALTAPDPYFPSKRIQEKMKEMYSYDFEVVKEDAPDLFISPYGVAGVGYINRMIITAPNKEQVEVGRDCELTQQYLKDFDSAVAACKADKIAASAPKNTPRP